MTKEELKKQVTDKINPLFRTLGTVIDGPPGMEEYSKRVFYRDDMILICDKLFEEAYKAFEERGADNYRFK